ncbi:hypothetical protein B0F90DRAFT_44735 [Multifurca ochricompacta]|uniref:Uncharacterized protein n=1 Tax=Multifurca ochricompacta TaxID=376703 RepID=A0AAD4QTM9_9AGAM|nr:hypothetical protein B0F90DRAFT_44735 [Multifurca ochricompacta]
MGSNSSEVAGGIYASMHAPKDLRLYETVGESTEKLGIQPTGAATGLRPTNSSAPSLVASIRAPKEHLQNQITQDSSEHSLAAPIRAIDQTLRAGSGGNCSIRQGKTPDLASGGDTNELELSTVTRCAVQGEEEGPVDNSGVLLDPADDHESVAGSRETVCGVDVAADLNDPGSTTRPRRSRRRIKPRRPRQKVPYFPPPRMQNLAQNSANNLLTAQARAFNASASTPVHSGGQCYPHAFHQPSQYHISAPCPIIPLTVIRPNHLGEPFCYTQAQHMESSHTAGLYPSPISSISSLLSPGPYHPMLHFPSPHR